MREYHEDDKENLQIIKKDQPLRLRFLGHEDYSPLANFRRRWLYFKPSQFLRIRFTLEVSAFLCTAVQILLVIE
jgi:hypothetical protein